MSIGDILYNKYRKILKAIDKADDEIEFDKEKVSDNTFLGVLEWIMMPIAKFIVKDDELLLAKLRRDITSITLIDAREIEAMRLDTLAILALCEFVLSMKLGLFIPNKGIENLLGSNSTIFLQQMLEEGRNLMNLVILVIKVQSKYH